MDTCSTLCYHNKTLVVSYDVYHFLVCVEWNEWHNLDTAISAGCSETQLMPYVIVHFVYTTLSVRLHNLEFIVLFFVENVSSIQPEVPVRILPGDTHLNIFTFLTCNPEPNSQLTVSDYISRSGYLIHLVLSGIELFRDQVVVHIKVFKGNQHYSFWRIYHIRMLETILVK